MSKRKDRGAESVPVHVSSVTRKIAGNLAVDVEVRKNESEGWSDPLRSVTAQAQDNGASLRLSFGTGGRKPAIVNFQMILPRKHAEALADCIIAALRASDAETAAASGRIERLKTSGRFLERLVEMVPPPETPFSSGDQKAFLAVEKELGRALPSDFKQLIATYGYGLWQRFWCVLNPFIGDGKQVRSWFCPRYGMAGGEQKLASLRAGRDQFPELHIYPIFPEPGGLFPWAMTDNGDFLYWLTEGDPDTWPTIHDPDLTEKDWKRYDLPCTAIVYGAISGELPIFAEPLGAGFQYGQPDAFEPRDPRPIRG